MDIEKTAQPYADVSKGTLTIGGRPSYEYMQELADRYDAGEKIKDQVIVYYDTLRLIWKHSYDTGDFSRLDDDFFDSLAAIEELVQRERIVERYLEVFGYAPEPILTQPLTKSK